VTPSRIGTSQLSPELQSSDDDHDRSKDESKPRFFFIRWVVEEPFHARRKDEKHSRPRVGDPIVAK